MATSKKPDHSMAKLDDKSEGIYPKYREFSRRQLDRRQERNGLRIYRALDFIGRYGGIDGEHHKQWVLDQVARALTGCPMVEKPHILGNYEVQGESEEYLEWVRQMKGAVGEDGETEYNWDEGIAP